MKVNLTLQEKLRDLRDERKLKQQEVADQTGIPLATISRIESNDDNQTSYQTVAALAKFYNVSTDYLFGITDNRQHRNIEIDALALSDSAIEILKSKKLSNRLISELLSHTDFGQLINAVEVYIDKKMMPQMQTLNAVYRLAETTIKDNYADSTGGKENGSNSSGNDKRDEILAFLQNAAINEDEYLRFRISERFNAIMKSLFDAHKADKLSPEHNEVIEDMKALMQGYVEDEKTDGATMARYYAFLKSLGLNAKHLTLEEQEVLIKALQKSPKAGRGGNRKKK